MGYSPRGRKGVEHDLVTKQQLSESGQEIVHSNQVNEKSFPKSVKVNGT